MSIFGTKTTTTGIDLIANTNNILIEAQENYAKGVEQCEEANREAAIEIAKLEEVQKVNTTAIEQAKQASFNIAKLLGLTPPADTDEPTE